MEGHRKRSLRREGSGAQDSQGTVGQNPEEKGLLMEGGSGVVPRRVYV